MLKAKRQDSRDKIHEPRFLILLFGMLARASRTLDKVGFKTLIILNSTCLSEHAEQATPGCPSQWKTAPGNINLVAGGSFRLLIIPFDWCYPTNDVIVSGTVRTPTTGIWNAILSRNYSEGKG